MFVMQVFDEPRRRWPPCRRRTGRCYEATPGWLTVAFGVAVGAGVLGSIGLLLRQRWAVPCFAVSLVALLVQIGGAYLVTPVWAGLRAGGAGDAGAAGRDRRAAAAVRPPRHGVAPALAFGLAAIPGIPPVPASRHSCPLPLCYAHAYSHEPAFVSACRADAL